VIHEKIVYSLDRVAAEDGRVISDCTLTLDHVGYEGDQTHKHLRNLPLLEAQLGDEPDNIFNWTHLGRVNAGLSRHDEAEAALQQAVALARQTSEEVGGVAFATLIHLRFDNGQEVDDLIAEARDRYPDNWSIVWLEGRVHLRAERNEEAAACFRTLLGVDRETAGPVSYTGRLFGENTHALLGLALFRMGRYSEAAEAYAAAERLAPDEPEYRVKRMLAESRVAQGPA
jgi:cytochrome c-type biogenesis protein CcmH/NrfG